MARGSCYTSFSMLRRRSLVLFLLFLWTATAFAATRPKLVFLLVIDQFRADYLERFRADFVPGGFNRLLANGAVFTNANYDYSLTETAPGHATIATGANPSSHGIVANEWLDRAENRRVTSVEDSDFKLIGIDPPDLGASPRRLMGTTLADEIRLASGGKAKVVGISMKDRAAILPAGKNPTAVFWMDSGSAKREAAVLTGRVVTSTYYMDALPAWVSEFNQKFSLAGLQGREWRALGAPESSAPLVVIKKLGIGNPEVGPTASPFANEELFELAKRAAKEYKLGTGATTDFLSLSLSANDYIGHAVGPDSPLVRDMVLRTDRMLAEFLRFLDQQTGPGAIVMAMTADHGVAPAPEKLKAERYDAGRVNPADIAGPLEKALRIRYGSAADEKWVESGGDDIPNVKLNRSLIEKYHTSADEAARCAGEAAKQVPGVYAYFTASQLSGARSDGSVVARRAANSFFPERSGDLFLVWKPFYIRNYSGIGASHGTPWSYDTHVPIILLGPGIRPGVYQSPAAPTDIAVTLAALLGINAPSVSTGRVLTEALAPERKESNGPRAPKR